MTPAAYLKTLAATVAGCALLVTGINAAMDPYGVLGTPLVAGFNAFKSQAGQRGATFKTHGIATVRPKAIILGNSRAEVGFDPEHPAWPATLRPVYNAALPGTGPSVALDYLAHALRASDVGLAVIALGFLDFRVRGDEPIAALAAYRAAHPQVAEELAARVGAERSLALAQR